MSAKTIDSEKYRGFQREIETLQRLRDSALAILPIYDAHLPDGPAAELAWFSMPVAQTLELALAGKPLALKVRALRDIALTLADLEAEERIHHRDVKPANLYCHDGRYVIGDFGLVKRLNPQDETITRPNHVPGPRNYMPPEAFLRPSEAAEGPIDVYCFAKTLWVIAADEKGPPGGQIRAHDRWALGRVLDSEPRAAGLDTLIEQATSNDSEERPTIAEVAEALARWLHGRPSTQTVSATATMTQATEPESAVAVARTMTELLDVGSEVGRREFLKAERRRFETTLRSLLEERQTSTGGDDLETFAHAIEPVQERYLAAHLPLVEHRSPLLEEQISELARIGNTPYVSPHSDWSGFPSWSAWWLGHAIGAFAVSVENLEAIRLLFAMTIEQNLGPKSLPAMLTPDAWRALMEAALPVQRAPQGAQFDHHVRTLAESDLLKEMYPEFIGTQPFGAARYVFDFNFLGSLWAADRNEKVIGFWTTRHGGAHGLAARLRNDDQFRARVAQEAFGITPDEFNRRVHFWVGQLIGEPKRLLLLPGGYSVSDALAVLLGEDP